MSGRPSFRFAFGANAFRRYPPVEAVAAVAEAGFSGVELMFDEPHLVPVEAQPEAVEAMERALREYGMAVPNANAFTMRMLGDTWHPSWIEPDPALRRKRVEHTLASLRLAARLGVPSISTEPGGPLSEGMSRASALDLFMDGLEEVLPTAEAEGVALLVEPEPGLLIETSRQFLDFIAGLRSPMLALNFDVGHFYCVGEDPVEAFERLRPYVRHLHLEDIAADRTHRHLAPGSGAIDLPAFLRALAAGGYTGWVTVELYPYQEQPAEVARAAREYLDGVLRDIDDAADR